MSNIKSFEDACNVLQLDPTVLPDVSKLSEKRQKHTIANYKWDVIVEALNFEVENKEWVPDYSNDTEPKYELWLRYSPSSGWSLDHVDYWYTITHCGARRTFKTRKVAQYAGENLLDYLVDTF